MTRDYVGGAVPFEDGRLDFSHLTEPELLKLYEETKAEILETGNYKLLYELEHEVNP